MSAPSIHIAPSGDGYRLEANVGIARPLADVFAFFASAENLETLTPPWLRFSIVTPTPIAMHQGALIDYRLRVRGLPLKWQSEITAWQPPEFFVDEMRKGPYRYWRHEHRFEMEGDTVLVRDRVEYAAPGGRLIHALFVRRDLRKIFAYRHARLQEAFPKSPTLPA